jgi:hypothetical protein
LNLPAGEARTGVVLAAGLALLAQSGAAAGPSGWACAALHAACAALAYLLFVNLSRRKLGAPLLAAVLFAAHPLAASVLVGDDAGLESAGTALGLLSGVLLARTPLAPRLLWPALASYAAALPLAPAIAAVPFLVAAGVVAYHGLPPARLLTKRVLPRFAVFVVPLAGWIAWTALRAGPQAPPRFDAVAAFAADAVLPFGARPSGDAVAGAILAGACLLLGLVGLRRRPKVAWPLLAVGASLVAAATLPAWLGAAGFLAPLAFAALVVGEALEDLHYRFGGAVAMPLAGVLYVALAALSHLRTAGR